MTTKLMKKSLLFVALLAATGAQAAEEKFRRPTPQDTEYQHRSQFLFSLGLQNGGDVLARLRDVETGEIVDQARAGGYWFMEFGGVIAFPNMPVSLQVTGGYLATNVVSNINESRADFKRYTVSFIPFYNFGRQRVGLGAVAHIEPTVTFKPDGQPNDEWKMDDEVAAILQWDVRYDQNISVVARSLYVKYEITEGGPVGEEADGRAFGVHFTYSF